MRKNLRVLTVGVVFALCVPSLADGRLPAGEWTLTKLEKIEYEVGEGTRVLPCGDYFTVVTDDAEEPVAFYFFKRGGDILTRGKVSKEFIRPVIVEEKAIPTAEHIPFHEGKLFWLVLRLSRKDYREATCLPPPYPRQTSDADNG